MAGDHLSNDEVSTTPFAKGCNGICMLMYPQFFTRLTDLFEFSAKKGHGSVYLTQKRLTHDTLPSHPATAESDPLWDTYHPETPVPVIVRAQNNKSTKREGTDRENRNKVKISTVVQPGDIDAFYTRYAEACKAGMGALKKRDRKKGKKAKGKKKTEAKA